ncbi:lysozyme inhibitor LprI family protein [Methylobacterium haplocladii]|uniref:Lysozyme inhibitor LprI N-terminal domain-containing protein n=1 Tax=Methylobacterium haplocladii TaxID=1176176 RepID=A0A512IKW6_9HYPH|nr:lysozyme inhibitor LprI family protein [Methylobacterium haplocladii]GEO98282.1 hypothetical protein MHA02_06700 [Methylobacterium haplocladii]GJD84323.1 hypothetical protein HPGCJGGD_2199 [Methylobacterium haplocladii]GLS58424.1 hypothetical protein GCM10007887_10840 [Methylobacterium haplocladii]
MEQQLRTGAVAIGILLTGIVPAAAFDCAKARLPIETAICADHAAKASDDAMEAAFETLRPALAGPQNQAALDDQRAWLKQRNTDCLRNKTPASCIADANRARIGILTAQPESGPGLERRPQPFFVRQAGSRAKVDVALQLYKFAEPASPGERLLNARTDETAAKTDFRKEEPEDRDWSREESWTIAYASPVFLSVWAASYDYSGGAHGSTGGRGIHIDLRRGRILTFADLFDAKAATEIERRCLKQIKAEKIERGAGDDDQTDLPKQVAEVVKDLGNWSIKEKAASVYFAHYAIASYAKGTYDCDLPMDVLNTLSKVPLPPR